MLSFIQFTHPISNIKLEEKLVVSILTYQIQFRALTTHSYMLHFDSKGQYPD